MVSSIITIAKSNRLSVLAYWNSNIYGHSITINKHYIVSSLYVLAVLVPVIIPVWLIPIVSKYIKDITIRYNIRGVQ